MGTPKKRLFVLAAGVGVITLCAMGAKDPQASEDDKRRALPGFSIDDKIITVGFLEDSLRSQNPMIRKEMSADDTKRVEFFDRFLKGQLMAREARRRGFATHPEVNAIRKNKLASLVHRQIVESAEDIQPTEEDLREYYKANIDKYKKDEKMKARHIVVSDEAKAAELLREALDKKVSQQAFRRMAKEHSLDQDTSHKGGNLGYFTRDAKESEDGHALDPELVKAVFKLEKNGQILPRLLKTDRGYHIVMRSGHQKKKDDSFEESKARIASLVKLQMRKKHVENSLNKLKKEYKVQVFEENLKYIVIDLSQGRTDSNASKERNLNNGKSRRKISSKP